MAPLVAQRLIDNVATLFDGIADVLARHWNVVRKLDCDARDESASMSNVTVAAREEKAGCKTLFIVVAARNRPCYRRLARTRQAAKPEDMSPVSSISPAIDLVQQVGARAVETGMFMPPCKCVKGRVRGAG